MASPPDGADGIRQAWTTAREYEPPPDGDDDDHDHDHDGPPWSVDEHEIPPDRGASITLPDDCPVIPLGISGQTYYFLDALRQLQSIPWDKLGRSSIIGLFGCGAREYLRRVWPRKSLDKKTQELVTTGWVPDDAQFALAEGCAVKGVWSPRARVRGAGAWKAINGDLILHCGDRVFRWPAAGGAATADLPGMVGEHVYPAAPATPRPDQSPSSHKSDGPGRQLLALIKTWNWMRPDIDPILLLGWVCAGMIGGSLKFRPMIWIPGEYGTGKSALQELIKWLLGTTGLLSVANATAAGIQQTLGYASLPAALDEQEASSDNRKVNAVLELAREASTGAVRIRGGSDQQAHSFNIQSAFMFSSILMPSMEPQDVSRFAVLELAELKKDAIPPVYSEEDINWLGRQLLRCMVDGWSRFAQTLEVYRSVLMKSGRHSGRGADLFGTLLACADLALSDQVPDADRLERWAQKLHATNLAELDGAMSDKQTCLNFLVTSTLTDQHNRSERTIAGWLARAHGDPSVPEEDREAVRLKANEILSLHGLKWYPKDGFAYLAVSNSHQGVARLFKDTKWAATAGNPGVWRQSLARLPGAIKGHQVKFPPNNRSVLVPLAHVLPDIPAPPGAKDSEAAGPAPGTAVEQLHTLDAQGRSAASSVDTSPDPEDGDDFDRFNL